MDTVSQDTLHSKLDASRKDLLDLGLRNSLLNFKPSKVRGVEVVDELASEVFRILVQSGKSMSFIASREEQLTGPTVRNEGLQISATLAVGHLARPELELNQPPDEDEGKPAARHRDTKLQTNYPSAQLQARLLKTEHAARTHIEEQGANVLFLALGMLTWYEADQSNEPRHAPLLLVPVRLERSDALERFHITYTGEDIGDNLSLVTKLKNDFGMIMPSIPAVEDIDLTTYFSLVDTLVRSKARWSVTENSIVLGFFSFGKFLMYKDLDAASWPDGAKPPDNAIVQALFGDGFKEGESSISDSDHLDQFLKPAEVNTVIDADSSQTLAILDVNCGRNLVIQGPPGTGKSQTITNIIAEALGHGRKVLFVSEKMAALEVVKRRLDSIGLGDACLELHSHKTNKKNLILELARTIELGKPRLTEGESDLLALEQARDRLNEYAVAINTPIGQSGVSPHQAYGRLLLLGAQLAEAPHKIGEVQASASWSMGEFRWRRDLVAELEHHLRGMGAPKKHPFWGSTLTVFLPTDQGKLRESIDAAAKHTTALAARSTQLAKYLGLATPGNRAEVRELLSAARRAHEAPELRSMSLEPQLWQVHVVDTQALLTAGSILSSFNASYRDVFQPEAWTEDLSPVRQNLDTYGRKWWRFVSGPYRNAQKKARALFNEAPPSEIDLMLQVIDALVEAREQKVVISERVSIGAKLYGDYWQGEESKWDDLLAKTKWLQGLFHDVQSGSIPAEIVSWLALGEDRKQLQEQLLGVEEALSAQEDSFEHLTRMLELTPERALGDGAQLGSGTLLAQQRQLKTWAENLPQIFTFATYNNISNQCRQAELGSVIDLTLADNYEPSQAEGLLARTLEHSWLFALLDSAFLERPILGKFSGINHEHTRDTFSKLDELALAYNRAKLAALHWRSLPRPDAGGQMQVLKRETVKKTRHLPIRQLIRNAGGVIQQIKPIFMMSPLSIATFLSQDGAKFDLVVFDEASQVRPVEGLGAVLRAKQVVVVGDTKQLPPTSFFDTLVSYEEMDQENTTSDLESILGLFAAQGAPQRMLRWHYRSRHESLIAVSNHEFYNDKLVVFPSPDSRREATGLAYHHLANTVYDPGRSRTNKEEAVVVAQAVMEHARRSPDLTLGVATFSMPQMHAIIDQLEILRREDPSCENFFSDHPYEPFFVKNLETVQGDERDVIFISIGYGRTADGYLAMNFGPLNRDGGERRLNVLITRARLRCEVFTNLSADDIDLERSKATGVRSLKQFLNYARSGNMDIPTTTGRQPDSPFEEAVMEALLQQGYEVRPQVGSAGFFIDLAVVDKDRPGRYLLGIECDGATYHSARSARDRDRLRQQVLEGLGWKIHRIWSTDWFRDPRGELKRVVGAIEAARVSGAGILQTQRKHTASTMPTIIERDADHKRPARLDELPRYVTAKISVNTFGWGLDELNTGILADYVAQVVRVEGPVHTNEVFRRIAEGAGVKRIGSRIDAALNSACYYAQHEGLVYRKGDFLWPSSDMKTELRSRTGVAGISPKIEMIAPEEIALAIERVVADAHSVDEEKVYLAACQLFGYARVGEEMRQRVSEVIERMVKHKELVKHLGKLSPVAEK